MITVIKPGLLTTIQDKGRWGYQAYGMPVAGTMDRYSYCVANILAGNLCDAAVLEMTMLGGTFRFDTATWAAIGGADMQARLNGEKITNWSSFFAAPGSTLTFGYAENGCRSYLAVHGGIDVPLVLGSRSTYTRAGVGGLGGKALQVGSALALGTQSKLVGEARTLPAGFTPHYTCEFAVRVLLGPQDDLFAEEGITTFFNSRYILSTEADRMGYRFEGPQIKHRGAPDIISDALCQGAIQVPGHGMPIIMMADRATTGGYAKLGAVIGPDLACLAQAKPGDVVKFILCSEEEAVDALQYEQERYHQLGAWRAAPLLETAKGRQYKLTINGQCYDVKVEEVSS